VLRNIAASDAKDSMCISLLAGGVSLNLEASSTEQLSSFLFGLQSLLNKGGRDVMVDQATASKPSGAKDDAAASSGASSKRQKRFSIVSANPTAAELESSRYAGFKRALLALPPQENLRLMSEGRDFYLWRAEEATGRVERALQHVYFVSAEESARNGGQVLRLGALFHNDVGKKENQPTKRLIIADLTDVFGAFTLHHCAAS
jgi:hypothetical protein